MGSWHGWTFSPGPLTRELKNGEAIYHEARRLCGLPEAQIAPAADDNDLPF
jgi:hypothetical protein